MTVPMPVCMRCVHYDRSRPITCKAFPERIPDLVWLQGDPHTARIEGDHGILFEPKPNQP